MTLLKVDIAALIIAILGIALIAASLASYYRRTRDPLVFRAFWMKRDVLTPGEYALNRAGFWIAAAAMAVMSAVLCLVRFFHYKIH